MFDIPGGELDAALRATASAARVPLTFTAEQTRGMVTDGVRGALTPQEAFARLLSRSPLQAVRMPNGGYVLRPRPATGGADEPVTTLPTTVVTARGPNDLPEAYAGGEVARGARLGLLGNLDYMDTPFSVASYTAQTVRDQQATSVAEVLTTSDSSVRASIGSANRYDALTIRGFRVENDEMSLNGLYGLVPAYRINPDPVERIELLKGPGTFLNGMPPWGSVGGTVNLVTKRAEDTPLTRVTAEYSSDSRLGAHLDMGRRLGDDKEFGIRFNGAFRNGGTTIDGQTTQNGSGSLGLDYRKGGLRWSADIIYQDDWMREAARGYNLAPGVTVPDAPNPRTNLAQSYDFSSARSLTALTRAEYDINSRVTVYGAIGGNRFDYRKREAPGATIVSDNGDASSTSTYQRGKTRAFSGEVGIRTSVDTGPVNHRLVLTGNRLDQDTWLGQTSYASYATNIYRPVKYASLGSPLSETPEAKSSESTIQSVAIADTLSVKDGLVQLTVGARRQNVDTRSFDASGNANGHYDRSATTPSAALVIRPTQAWSLYANYIEALTPGASPPADAANPDQVFAPYKSRQYEIGTKLDYGTFGATLGLFRIRQPQGIVNPVSKVFSLDGEQQNQGVELNGFGEISRGVRVLGGVTYLDARQRRTAGGVNDGNHAIGAPNWQGNLEMQWDTPFLPGLTLMGRAIHSGGAYVSADNTQSIPAWTRFDAGGKYTTRISGKEVVFRATVTNLANKRYWEANPSGYLISGMPRTLWLSVQADF
ncbi:TonB-dependent siderophore receptor [Achromobacter aloeverae]